MTNFQADQNAKMLQDFFDSAKGDIGVLSVVDIGLNPNSHPLKESTYASWEMGGMVTVGIGKSSWAGCDVEADSELSMHIVGATLTIDGFTLVEKGRLQIK